MAEDDVDEALKDIERAVYLKRYLTEVRGSLGACGLMQLSCGVGCWVTGTPVTLVV